MIQTLTIKGELPDLNTEINSAKRHWAIYANHKKEWTDTVTWLSKGLHQISEPSKFIFNWYCKNKKKDPDNIVLGVKYILDGLVRAGILKSDGWDYVKGFIHRFYIDKENPRVVITITGHKST